MHRRGSPLVKESHLPVEKLEVQAWLTPPSFHFLGQGGLLHVCPPVMTIK